MDPGKSEDWGGGEEESTGRKVVALGDILGQPSKSVGVGVTVRKQLMQSRGFSHGLVRGKGSVYQCRKCGFDLWIWKIFWKRKWQPTPVFFFIYIYIILFIHVLAILGLHWCLGFSLVAASGGYAL